MADTDKDVPQSLLTSPRGQVLFRCFQSKGGRIWLQVNVSGWEKKRQHFYSKSNLSRLCNAFMLTTK